MHLLIFGATCSFALLFIVHQKRASSYVWQKNVRLSRKKYDKCSVTRYLYGLMTKKCNRVVKNYMPLPVFISNFDPAKNM